ncbi:MAG TPA: hypothetical protein QF624_08690 [Dehalococcoidia bacterium]|nr:hypothetical protein [Dehalococcoidia bacterium]
MCWLNYMAPTTTAANDKSAAGGLLVLPLTSRPAAAVERPSPIGHVEAVAVVTACETVEAAG